MRVLVVGDLMVALSARVDRLPLPGENMVVDDPVIQVTGVAANLAWNLSRLGLDAEVVGGIGRDALGEAILEELRSWSVGVDHVDRSPGATSLFVILVDGAGERTMVGTRGAAASFVLDPQLLDQVRPDWVHISGYSLLDRAMAERCSRLIGAAGDVPWSLDLEGVAFSGRPAPIERATVFCNLDEYRGYFGPDGASPASRDEPLVVRRGPEGCELVHLGGIHVLPGFAVPAVDSTGAGDAFDAAFIAARLRGMTPVEACRWGNGAAAVKVQARGTRANLSVERIEELVAV